MAGGGSKKNWKTFHALNKDDVMAIFELAASCSKKIFLFRYINLNYSPLCGVSG